MNNLYKNLLLKNLKQASNLKKLYSLGVQISIFEEEGFLKSILYLQYIICIFVSIPSKLYPPI